MACAEYSFYVPSLEELVGVLQKGLKGNFADVQVSVVDCPDLTKEPFTFPVKGICGKTRIVELGGVPYLLPLVNKKKVYDLNKVAKEIKLPGAFILGAGAGPFQTLGFNSEAPKLTEKVTATLRHIEEKYKGGKMPNITIFCSARGKKVSENQPKMEEEDHEDPASVSEDSASAREESPSASEEEYLSENEESPSQTDESPSTRYEPETEDT